MLIHKTNKWAIGVQRFFDSKALMTVWLLTIVFGVSACSDDNDTVKVKVNAYVADPQDTGHRPGIYIEFKEPDLNPENENGFRCRAGIPDPFHRGRTYDNSQAPSSVPDATETLKRLGY